MVLKPISGQCICFQALSVDRSWEIKVCVHTHPYIHIRMNTQTQLHLFYLSIHSFIETMETKTPVVPFPIWHNSIHFCFLPLDICSHISHSKKAGFQLYLFIWSIFLCWPLSSSPCGCTSNNCFGFYTLLLVTMDPLPNLPFYLAVPHLML